MHSDEDWMQKALGLARRAQEEGEVPVGAVVVKDDEVLGEGWNRPIASHDPSSHAEINALRSAALKNQNYRLNGATLYVTLEPCVMCAGAITHARIQRVVYAASDPRGGAAGSVFQILPTEKLNHHLQVQGGILEEEAAELLRAFFRQKREK